MFTNMQNSLITITSKEYEMASALATDFGNSGLFPNIKNKAQAMTIVLVGAEMGVSAIAALTGINLVFGKPVIGANLMAERIKSSGQYNYEIERHTESVCTIRFMKGEKNLGTSEFTIEDARKAQIIEKNINWTKYPKNMLFARALSNGQRWFCPDVFRGQNVYTPDELGAVVNETGDIDLKASSRVITSEAYPKNSLPAISDEEVEEIRKSISTLPNPSASEKWILQGISDNFKESYSELEELPKKHYKNAILLVNKLLEANKERQNKMNELHANLESFSQLHELEHDQEIVRGWLKQKAGVQSMTELSIDNIKELIKYIKVSVMKEDLDEDFYGFYKQEVKNRIKSEVGETKSQEKIEETNSETKTYK